MTRTTGTDHVDLQECRRRGIVVVRTPGVSSDAVSEQAMALVRDATERTTPSMAPILTTPVVLCIPEALDRFSRRLV